MIDRSNMKSCPMCRIQAVVTSYLENQRYRYKCRECGQYFEYNAPSWLAADVVWKYVICGEEIE